MLDASYTDPSELRERLEDLFPDKDYEIRVSGSTIALHSPFSRLGSNEYLDGERQLCLDDSESADSSEILFLIKILPPSAPFTHYANATNNIPLYRNKWQVSATTSANPTGARVLLGSYEQKPYQERASQSKAVKHT